LLAAGLTNREIGEELSLTLHTVKWYVKQIFSKLHVRRRTEAAAVARAQGLLDAADQITVATPSPASSPLAADLPRDRALLDTFVGREQELAHLERFLHGALSGASHIVFVTGEAGSGKSALVRAFCRRAQVRHPRLVAVGGHCNAFTGIGDPYLPFREILTQLSGDVPGGQHVRTMDSTQVARLSALTPYTVQALIEHGPTLLNTLLDGRSLLSGLERNRAGNAATRTQLKSPVDAGCVGHAGG